MQLKLKNQAYGVSGFDVDCLSTEDTPRDDLDGLDASAAVVANLLSSEPPGSKSLYWLM